jgi:hypothetical protein
VFEHPTLARLSLQERERAILVKAIGLEPNDKRVPTRLEMLRDIAFIELVEWILGRRRFNTISESDTSRVLKIFLEMREEQPTLEQLVNELALSHGRAVSLLSRLKYGQGRALRALNLKAAKKEIEEALADAKEENDRKTISVDSDIYDLVQESAWSIMKDFGRKTKGNPYPGAEDPDFTNNKWGGTVRARTKMWKYIIDWLDSQARNGALG